MMEEFAEPAPQIPLHRVRARSRFFLARYTQWTTPTFSPSFKLRPAFALRPVRLDKLADNIRLRNQDGRDDPFAGAPANGLFADRKGLESCGCGFW